MTVAVDLANLRSMTDGDVELEKELFLEFNRSFQENLAGLRQAMDTSQPAQWRSKAHAMKGICFNLGAQPLGELCRQAQDQPEAPSEQKTALIGQIEQEYERVKAFLAAI